MHLWQASIFETKEKKDIEGSYKSYRIVVQDRSHSWFVERRFSDFHSLGTKLKSKFPQDQLPPCPPKSLLSFLDSPKFSEDRVTGLEKYMKSLLRYDSITSKCREVLEFLDPENKSQLRGASEDPQNALTVELLPEPSENMFEYIPEPITIEGGGECYIRILVHELSDSLEYLFSIQSQLKNTADLSRKLDLLDKERSRIAAEVSALQAHKKVILSLCRAEIAQPEPSSNSNAYGNPFSGMYGDFLNAPAYSGSSSRQVDHYAARNTAYDGLLRTSNDGFYSSGSTLRTSGNSLRASNDQVSNQFYPMLQPSYNQNPPSRAAYTSPTYSPSTGRDQSSVAWVFLRGYLDRCLNCIEMAILWEGSLECRTVAEFEEGSTVWCELEERVKWYEAEAERLSLLVHGEADQVAKTRADLKKLWKQLEAYNTQLQNSSNHKCKRPDPEHAVVFKTRVPGVMKFIVDTRAQTRKAPNSESHVVELEGQMFKILQETLDLKTLKASVETPQDEKAYETKSAALGQEINALSKRITECRVSLLKPPKKEDSLTEAQLYVEALANRLEDLQENMADLIHTFEKAHSDKQVARKTEERTHDFYDL